jgi:flagellar motility protein MotE (MotC chaperone)
MIRLLREFRLIPVVLVATGCLFALKIVGLMFDGGYLLSSRAPRNNNRTIALAPSTQMLEPQTVTLSGAPSSSGGRPSWMQELFGYPEVTSSINPSGPVATNPVIVTGSSAAAPPASKEATLPAPTTKPPEIKPPVINGTPIQLDGNRPVSPAERAILERLHERRQELDKRARELDMREGMLKESEQRLGARMNELKQLEAKGGPDTPKGVAAETSRFKNLATMYENMKAKDAAKIFDRLDMKVLLDMTSQINPRKMSEILAQMSPDAAERLTMELASRANGGEKAANPNALPKIEGRPNGS